MKTEETTALGDLRLLLKFPRDHSRDMFVTFTPAKSLSLTLGCDLRYCSAHSATPSPSPFTRLCILRKMSFWRHRYRLQYPCYFLHYHCYPVSKVFQRCHLCDATSNLPSSIKKRFSQSLSLRNQTRIVCISNHLSETLLVLKNYLITPRAPPQYP